MADEKIMEALEENYRLLVSLRNERAKGLQMVATATEGIAKVTPKIIGLAALVDSVPEDSEIGQFLLETASTGITDAVRSVLRSNPAMNLRPTNIRDALIKMGVKLSYQNPLAVIGSTLKRLEEAGEIRKTGGEGGARYSWIPVKIQPPVRVPTLGDALRARGIPEFSGVPKEPTIKLSPRDKKT
jgi:hypothetical protein